MIFLELVQNDGNNKSFKMLSELVPNGCMPMPWGKMSFLAQDQVSGDRYRTVGRLIIINIIIIIIKTIWTKF